MIVDISMYQHGLVLDDLPETVTGVIIKASQGTYEDPLFPYFLAQARANPRWKWIGWYHFLSDKGVQAEAAHFLNLVSAAGGLQPREFAVLDWENNAITGYQPPMSDARAWMTIAAHSLPGRVAWYSYRSNAIKARNSGDFPWPLWLADPNPDGLDWAHTLDAFLLQNGQQELVGINIDVNDIIDIATLDELTGDDMALSDEDVQRIAVAVWDHAITKGDETEPARQWILFPIDELQRPDLLQARLVAAIGTTSPGTPGAPGNLTITLSGTATPT